MAPDATKKIEIERLLLGLSRTEPNAAISRAIQDLLNGEDVSPLDRSKIVREDCCPHADRWQQSALAIWAVGHTSMSDRAREDVVQALVMFADRSQRDALMDATISVVARASATVGFLVAAVGAVLSLFALALGFAGLFFGVLATIFFAVVCWLGTFTLGMLAAPLIAARLRNHSVVPRSYAIELLARWKEPVALGALAREFNRSDMRTLALALQAIESTLTAVTPEMYGAFSAADQTDIGFLLLDYSIPTAIRVGVVEALGKVGGAPALHAIRTASAQTADKAVAAAARHILPILESRAELERNSARLVRPTTAPSDDSAILVRPAASGPGADPALLLHVSESDD